MAYEDYEGNPYSFRKPDGRELEVIRGILEDKGVQRALEIGTEDLNAGRVRVYPDDENPFD